MKPMDLPNMGMPQVEQLHTTFSSSPVGFTEERAGDKQPDSAFDSVRPEMHASTLNAGQPIE